ncbi:MULTISPECIES: CynX/NimT family MFS transporter [Actinomycetes]|uniref:MFS transporter n=2 Tax=Actinomycetes TaxID=1760 RepID=A0ABP6LUM0_9MICC
MRTDAQPGRGATALAVLALALLAVCLRPAATSLGPVLAEVEAAFALQGWQSGLLTALPGAAFVIFGAISFLLLRRLGLFWSLAICAAAIGTGLGLRVLVDSWWGFAAFTTLSLAGMAMGNVVLPVFAKARFPERQAVSVTVFMVGLGLGASVPALLTAPLAEHVGGWRLGLGVWAGLPLVALIAWAALRRLGGVPAASTQNRGASGAVGRITASSGAWILLLYFGLQSLHAYTHFGWLARIYRDAGLDPVAAGAMVAIIVAGGIPGGFIAPQIVVRRWHVRSVLIGYGLISAVGYTGLLVAPTATPWLWAICLAIGGFSFPSALALITARTRDPEVTARASGFIQSGGYVFAALGPLAIGVVLERTGTWTVPLVGLIVLALAMAVVAWWASSPDSLDDEVAPDGPPPGESQEAADAKTGGAETSIPEAGPADAEWNNEAYGRAREQRVRDDARGHPAARADHRR